MRLPLALNAADFDYALVVAAATVVSGILYRRAWRRTHAPGRVPSGFGALLAPAVIGAAIVSKATPQYIVALGITLAATLVYWIDDVRELSARVRILISFVAGCGIGAAYFITGDTALLLGLGGCLAAGLACVALTNIVNFYDGADLNLATFIALTAVLILSFGPEHRVWAPVALSILAFTLPFALMNSRPKTIYLGDSGSFAFAALLTIMAVAFIADINSLPPEAAIPAALPAFDVFFVFAVRVREKHDLLTRNYLHLYQRLNQAYRGFAYLLPQLINVALCITASKAMQAAGMGRMLSVIAAIIGVTIPFYFLCRRLFLGGKPVDPAQQGA